MTILDDTTIEHRKESCKTYLEQTKLLTQLASAFIIAPAVVLQFKALSSTGMLIAAEILFVVSVLSGYFTLGALAGSQRKGEYDVYRPAVMIAGVAQCATYLIGIVLFGLWFMNIQMF